MTACLAAGKYWFENKTRCVGCVSPRFITEMMRFEIIKIDPASRSYHVLLSPIRNRNPNYFGRCSDQLGLLDLRRTNITSNWTRRILAS